MGFKIRDFYEQALQRDFSRKYQMRVLSIGGRFGPDDNVFITTSNLPGYTVNNISTEFMGLKFNIPGSASFPGSDAWTVTFRSDLNLDIRHYMEQWQRQVFNALPTNNYDNLPESSTGYYHIPDISQTIRLALHDRDGIFYRKYVLVGVYPTAIGNTAYTQTDQGAIQEFDVTLAYQWWELETKNDAGANILPGYASFDEDNIGPEIPPGSF